MEFYLPQVIGYGRLDSILEVFDRIKDPAKRSTPIVLNWTHTQEISPAGHAILASLFDWIIEHRCPVQNKFIKASLKKATVVKNLLELSKYPRLPKPSIHDEEAGDFTLSGQENSLNMAFAERFQAKFSSVASEDLVFSCQLILNELMQNSVDHSTAERYYLFAGLWRAKEKKEIHVGVTDMGVSIPAKLAQKYKCVDDKEYIQLAMKEGVTTRRMRQGGLGLYHTFETLKSFDGTLTILSRDAQMIRYFKNKTVRISKTKYSLSGTWCFVRFPLAEKK